MCIFCINNYRKCGCPSNCNLSVLLLFVNVLFLCHSSWIQSGSYNFSFLVPSHDLFIFMIYLSVARKKRFLLVKGSVDVKLGKIVMVAFECILSQIWMVLTAHNSPGSALNRIKPPSTPYLITTHTHLHFLHKSQSDQFLENTKQYYAYCDHS